MSEREERESACVRARPLQQVCVCVCVCVCVREREREGEREREILEKDLRESQFVYIPDRMGVSVV